jgi:hypothetical protein
MNKIIQMKKTLIIFAIFLSLTKVFSQNLSIKEIVYLREQGFTNIEDYLTDKNWKFEGGNEPKNYGMGNAEFSLNKNDINKKGDASITLMYNNSENESVCHHSFTLEFPKEDAYKNYISEIKASGYKLINSKMNGHDIKKVFQDSKTTIMVYLKSHVNNKVITNISYRITAVSKEDYDQYIAD